MSQEPFALCGLAGRLWRDALEGSSPASKVQPLIAEHGAIITAHFRFKVFYLACQRTPT